MYLVNIFLDNFENIVREHSSGAADLILEVLETLGNFQEIGGSLLVQI
jgi:hypothetical protein